MIGFALFVLLVGTVILEMRQPSSSRVDRLDMWAVGLLPR